jgi:hypothetical protein
MITVFFPAVLKLGNDLNEKILPLDEDANTNNLIDRAIVFI